MNINKINPATLKITDMRFADIDGAPKRCTLLKLYTNQGLVGYGEVRDASSRTYAAMLKSRILGENPCNVEKIFRRIKQFGGDSRQAGGVCAVELACCDLSQPELIEKYFDELKKNGEMPDILVANASVQAKIPWTEFPLDEAQKEMQVNFFATLRMFQRCYPKMKAQKWGRLIVVGSVNERRPHPDMCVYAATKSAQENLVRGIARQVASEGITVNNLCPGVFFTDRNKECLADPVYGPKVTAAIPMHDYAMPEDAAGTALLLASDAGRYITGATIMIDGGLSLPG